MSSPATAIWSTGSSAAAACRSSKRGTSASVSGSTSAHSSSMPTVRSWEASKTSYAAWRSIRSGQVEVERVQEVDRGAGGVHGHLGRHLQQGFGVVEDDLDPGVHQAVGQLLGGGGGHGEDADDDVLLLDHLLELVGMADGGRPDALADLRVVGVEDGHDAEAVVGEDVRRGDRLAEVAGPEQRDVVLAAGAEDLADLRDQRVDVVAHAALAELAEAGEVAADLGRVDVGVFRELLRGDRLLAHLAGLGEHLEVARQARGHAERETVGERAEPAVALLGDVAEAHRVPR